MSDNLWHVHDDGFTGTHTHRIGPFKVEHTHVDDPGFHVVEIDKGDGVRWRHKPPKARPVAPDDATTFVDVYDDDDGYDVEGPAPAGDDGQLDVHDMHINTRGRWFGRHRRRS